MTASALALLTHGRRYKRGAWKAKCPVHDERTASLSIREGKSAILVHCFGCGADGKAVMKALGLPTRELFYSQENSHELRTKLQAKSKLESLTRQFELMIVLAALEKGKERYWAAAIKRVNQDIFSLYSEHGWPL